LFNYILTERFYKDHHYRIKRINDKYYSDFSNYLEQLQKRFAVKDGRQWIKADLTQWEEIRSEIEKDCFLYVDYEVLLTCQIKDMFLNLDT
jgi:hypothetical protein